MFVMSMLMYEAKICFLACLFLIVFQMTLNIDAEAWN
jgi:hypothetical protein